MTAEIVLLIILIIWNAANFFFGSYFKTKGKNLATSQDISDLTHKVESVKQEFIEKNANLKSKLDLLTNLELNLKNDERNAIIDFHKAISNWISLLTESTPSLVDDYDDQEIQKKIYEYELAYYKVRNANALVELYVEDANLFELIHYLIQSVLHHLSPLPGIYLFRLKQSNIQIRRLDEIVLNSTPDLIEKNNKHIELIEERILLSKQYSADMIKGYKEVSNHENNYKEYLKVYIKKISAE